MNVLIVFAHPNPHSFNQAILEVVDTTLREHGHATRIHDLYQMQFRAVMDWAQGLVFIYPIWWFGPPAILKGWIDRVFTRKFAFEFTATGGMRGLLTQERALIINTLGGDEALYQRERWHELLVRPMTDGILGACGVRNVIHRAFYEVPTVTHIERQAMLDEVRELATAF
ncbi:MAG: NAD(P)H-dependent oxidoreductase [Candidatus Competibacteraceae bacterium]|nr:NAD(P)H-dependent oxidoreductase [Candidatus Competibacteraceae bacterium]